MEEDFSFFIVNRPSVCLLMQFLSKTCRLAIICDAGSGMVLIPDTRLPETFLNWTVVVRFLGHNRSILSCL